MSPVTRVEQPAQTPTPPPVDTLRPGETLDAFAARHQVTPESVRAANADVLRSVNNDRRHYDPGLSESQALQGVELDVPAAPMSVGSDPLTSDFNPTYPSPNSEYTVGGEGDRGGAAVTWNPGDGSVKGAVTQNLTPGLPAGASVQYQISRDAELTIGIKDASDATGTRTEYSVEGVRIDKVEVSAEGGSKRMPIEAEGSEGAGVRGRYKVTLPGSGHTAEQIAAINPFDPTSIPVGGTVTVDGQAFTQTELAGSFRHIGFETNVKDAAGVSYSVTRTDPNSIRVTMGPNQAVEAYNGVGLRSDIATAMLGRQDSLGDSTVRTAQFDLSNPDGQAAYAHFVGTGEVAHQTPGVSDVATIERVDYSSQTRLKLGLGPDALNVQADLAGPQNTGAFVKTTYPDGSYATTMNLQYSGNVPLQVTQRFDAAGNEVRSERAYEFKVNTDRPSYNWFERNIMGQNEGSEERANAELLNMALTGSPGGPVQPGKTGTITFSESQMTAFLAQTRAASDANQAGMDPLDLLVGGQNGQPAADNLDFAIALARNLGGDPYGFSQRLFTISQNSDGDLRNGQQPIDAQFRGS